MRKITLVAVLFVSFLFSTQTTKAQVSLNSEEQTLMNLVNNKRQSIGLRPLALSSSLVSACRSWSAVMYPKQACWHGSTNENVAFGYTSGEATFRQWMNSPPHRAFLLSPNITVAGIGRHGNAWTFRALNGNPVQQVKYVQSQPTTTKKSGLRRQR